MSWLLKLRDTYDACKGREPANSERLMPISHTTQQAHVEIVIDDTGRFREASVVDKSLSTTLIPCTEKSAGRSGQKPVAHPLCDKLQYLATDFRRYGGEVNSGYAKSPDEPHRKHMTALQAWRTSPHAHPKLDAIARYLGQGRVIEDLVNAKVLPLDDTGRLAGAWTGDKAAAPPIYKVLSGEQIPGDAFVRWRVQGASPTSGTWQDEALIQAWIDYYGSIQQGRGLCIASGVEAPLAVQHPAKLRHSGDKAKLISSNDSKGFTFRGRFRKAAEAVTVGFETTQKAHNALRWLIARQGSRYGEQVIVAWAISGMPVPDPMAATYALLLDPDSQADSTPEDAGQPFALRLKQAVNGYLARLDPTDDIVVMALDSATPGRMAITFYREINRSEFLAHLENWHSRTAWPQNFGKKLKFIGAPSPSDIAEAAYGLRVDDKLKKATRARLLPCIVDGMPIPADLVASAAQRAARRAGLDEWEWEKRLGIACALFRGSWPERNYEMSLELDRTTRDYLYGRLLAIADHLESRALHLAGETRGTTAARLMHRFSDRPASTWQTIWLSLDSYRNRLRSLRPPFLNAMETQIDTIVAAFDPPGEFLRDSPLSPEFLLGYHCQRQQLRPKPSNSNSDVDDVAASQA